MSGLSWLTKWHTDTGVTEITNSTGNLTSRITPRTVIVEGNVGAGKSTLLRHLARLQDVTTYPEQVDKWQDVGGVNLLELMYSEAERWTAAFQLYSDFTRLEADLNSRSSSASVRLMERSLFSSRYVFAQSLSDSGVITSGELAVLDRWFKFLTNNSDVYSGVDLIVYIRSDPTILKARIDQRGRSEEGEMPQQLLDRLHDYYEDWLINGRFPKPATVLVVNGNLPGDGFLEEVDKWSKTILGQ